MSGGNPGEGAVKDGLAQFLGIQVPEIEQQRLLLEGPEYLGDFQAGQESTESMGPSAMEGISTDPRLQEAQMAALSKISEMGETGLLPGEEAALRQARRGSAGEAQAKSAQLLSEFQRRGMGGSGMEMAARLQASQSGADRMSQESDRLMQMAQERALGAVGQSANLASQVRGQEFGEKSDIAKAQDNINQFNTANKQSVQSRNINAANQAGMRNLSERQRVDEANKNTKNMEQQHNKGLQQQQFNNQMGRAAGIAGQYSNLAQSQQQGAQLDAQQRQQMIQAGTAIGGAFMSDVTAKKNVKRVDVAKFLDELVPYQYEYKDEKHGEGKQLGVLAQDLEKSEQGQKSIINTAEGKMVDPSKLQGPMMASLADLHQRLKNLESGEA